MDVLDKERENKPPVLLLWQSPGVLTIKGKHVNTVNLRSGKAGGPSEVPASEYAPALLL